MLDEEKEILLKSKKSLMQHNTKLRKVIEILKPIVQKFTFSSEKLQLMLKNQKSIFNNAEIGFNSLRK